MVEGAGQPVLVRFRLPAQPWWLVRRRCQAGPPGTFPGEPPYPAVLALTAWAR